MTFLPKKRKKQKMGLRQPTHYRSPSYLRFVKSFECAIKGRAGHVCSPIMDPHHVRRDTDGGMGQKPSDWWCVPLCRSAHEEGDGPGMSWVQFEKKYGIDLRALAERLWRSSKHYREYLRNQQKDD